MLFLTLFFIFTYGYLVVNGKLFHETLIENTKFEIKKASNPELKHPPELVGKLIVITLYMLLFIVLIIVYLVKAISIDPYLYPTLTMIGLSFIGSLFTKKEDLTDEKQARKKLTRVEQKYTLKGTVSNLVRFTYFVYMFLVLVELI